MQMSSRAIRRLRIASGPILVGLGVFLFVSAGLVRFYAYPAFARVPASYDRTTHLEAKGAVVFNADPAILRPEETDLAIVSRTVADTGVDAPDGVVVWHNSVTISRSDGTVFQQSRERTPFDAASGAAVDCDGCGSWIETVEGRRDDVDRHGLVYKFPFNTQKQDYLVWDQTLGKTTSAAFDGEESVQGLAVYRFEQVVEPTAVGTTQVPGSVFGLRDATVTADLVYSVRVTSYVEPVTGSPVQRIEVRDQELRYQGRSVPVFKGTIRYTDEEVDSLVGELKTSSVVLGGMRSWIPVGLLVLGVLFAGIGMRVERQHRRSASSTSGAGELVTVDA